MNRLILSPRFGLKVIAPISPIMNPPMWAMKATLVLPPAYRNWRRNQKPMKIAAGIRANLIKKNEGTKLTILARGKNRTYAPNIPAIAPEAPTAGI